MRAAVTRRPSVPLRTVERPQIAVFGRPLIPDADAILSKPFGVGIAAQEPDQFIDNAFKMHALGGENGKTLTEVKSQLTTEHRPVCQCPFYRPDQCPIPECLSVNPDKTA